MMEALVWVVGLIAAATVVCEACVRAVTSFAGLKYGSTNKVAALEAQVAELQKEIKAGNSKDLRERLQECEKALRLRMF